MKTIVNKSVDRWDCTAAGQTSCGDRGRREGHRCPQVRQDGSCQVRARPWTVRRHSKAQHRPVQDVHRVGLVQVAAPLRHAPLRARRPSTDRFRRTRRRVDRNRTAVGAVAITGSSIRTTRYDDGDNIDGSATTRDERALRNVVDNR